MANVTRLRLIQFRAGYNLPVHAGREKGIFEWHGLDIEIAYTQARFISAKPCAKRNSRSATPELTMWLPTWKISAVRLQVSLFLWVSIAAS